MLHHTTCCPPATYNLLQPEPERAFHWEHRPVISEDEWDVHSIVCETLMGTVMQRAAFHVHTAAYV